MHDEIKRQHSWQVQQAIKEVCLAVENYYAELYLEEGGHALQLLRLEANPPADFPLEVLVLVVPSAPDAYEYMESCARLCERLFDQTKQWQQLKKDARENLAH